VRCWRFAVLGRIVLHQLWITLRRKIPLAERLVIAQELHLAFEKLDFESDLITLPHLEIVGPGFPADLLGWVVCWRCDSAWSDSATVFVLAIRLAGSFFNSFITRSDTARVHSNPLHRS